MHFVLPAIRLGRKRDRVALAYNRMHSTYSINLLKISSPLFKPNFRKRATPRQHSSESCSYEKISLSHSGLWRSSSRLLCRTTSVEGNCCTTALPPVSFFRGNEFDIGIFGTYVTGTSGGQTRTTTFDDGDVVTISSSGSPHGWGGGMDFTYYLPWVRVSVYSPHRNFWRGRL